jgi:hypothetical protein
MLPISPDSIGHSPGFPFLLVSYTAAGDHSFPDHAAVAVLGGIKLWHITPPWFGIILKSVSGRQTVLSSTKNQVLC